MLTGPANPLLAKIHNSKERMPCLLTGELEKVWLDQTLNSSDVLHLLAKGYPAGKLAAYTVGREFTSGSKADDEASVLHPHKYAELGDLRA